IDRVADEVEHAEVAIEAIDPGVLEAIVVIRDLTAPAHGHRLWRVLEQAAEVVANARGIAEVAERNRRAEVTTELVRLAHLSLCGRCDQQRATRHDGAAEKP